MYNYEDQKHQLFTDGGQSLFLKIRDKANAMLRTSGAFKIDYVIAGLSGDSWVMLACFDRMVELGEIKEVPTNGRGQDRIFVSAKY